MAEAEGLICPVCLAAYGTVDKLQSHFDSEHTSGITSQIPGSFRNLFSALAPRPPSRSKETARSAEPVGEHQVTREHWDHVSDKCHQCEQPLQVLKGKSHCRCCGHVFCSDHCAFYTTLNAIAQPDPDGVRCRVCRRCFEYVEEAMGGTKGVTRSLTAQFNSKRKKTVSRLDLETNKLLGRLTKLARALGEANLAPSSLIQWPGSASPGTQIEQSIVPWEDEKEATRCSVCHVTFGYFSRRHHCRLCGRVLCSEACSTTLPLGYLDKIRSRMGLKDTAGTVVSEQNRDYEVRVCKRCNRLMRRREIQCKKANSKKRPPIAQLYEELQAVKEQVSQLRTACADLAGRRRITPADVTHANSIRAEMKDLLNVCDGLSKRIAALPIQPPRKQKPQTAQQRQFPQAEAVQNNVRRATVQFIQDSVVASQTLPVRPTERERDRSRSMISNPASAANALSTATPGRQKAAATAAPSAVATAERRHSLQSSPSAPSPKSAPHSAATPNGPRGNRSSLGAVGSHSGSFSGELKSRGSDMGNGVAGRSATLSPAGLMASGSEPNLRNTKRGGAASASPDAMPETPRAAQPSAQKAGVPVEAEVFLEQRANLRDFLRQAEEVGQMDEARALRESIAELEAELQRLGCD